MKRLFSIFVVTFCSLQSVPITLAPAAELLRRFDEHLPKLKTFISEWGICEKIGGKSVEPGDLALLFSYGALDFAIGTNVSEQMCQEEATPLSDTFNPSPEAFLEEITGFAMRVFREGEAQNPAMKRLYDLRMLLNSSLIVLVVLDMRTWQDQEIEVFSRLHDGPRHAVDWFIKQILDLAQAFRNAQVFAEMPDSAFAGGKNPFR